MKKEYDIVIAGAGPAGLSLASELSKDFKVLVIEKGKIGQTSKSWISYEDRIERLGIPKEVISYKFDKWHFRYKGAEMIVTDKFVSLDEHKMLSYWIDRCIKNNVDFLDNVEFKKFKNNLNSAVINDRFEARLFIDCCGIKSPILKKEDMIAKISYINCYGAVVSSKKDEVCYYEVTEKNSGRWFNFGVTRLSEDRYFLLFFFYSDEKEDMKKYTKNFYDYSRMFFSKDFKVIEIKSDCYAVGKLRKHALDNIYLFGDAGLFCPGLIGMGFNEILKQYKKVAKHLNGCLKDNKLSRGDLETPASIIEDADSAFFRIFNEIINCLSEKDLKSITSMEGNEDIKRKLFRNDLSKEDLIRSIRLFFGRIDLENFILNTPSKKLEIVLKELSKLGEDIVIEELISILKNRFVKKMTGAFFRFFWLKTNLFK
jgi:flavin-dependent dehydrogenase